MTAVIAAVMTLFSALMAAVVFHWQREATRVANDPTANFAERLDARVSTATFAIQTFVFVGLTAVALVLAVYALLVPGGES